MSQPNAKRQRLSCEFSPPTSDIVQKTSLPSIDDGLDWWKRPHTSCDSAPTHQSTSTANDGRPFTCFVCESVFFSPPPQMEELSQESADCVFKSDSARKSTTPSLLHWFSPVSHHNRPTPPNVQKYQTHEQYRQVQGCRFCEQPTCSDCLQDCEVCHQQYCKMCLTVDYCQERYSVTVCKDCLSGNYQGDNADAMQLS